MAERTDHGVGPSEKARDHIEHIRSHTAREVAKVQEHVAAIQGLENVTVEAIGLLKEFVRAGVSNPIMGAASAIILADILQRAKVISSNTEAIVDGVALSVVGVSLGVQVAEAAVSVIDSLNPIDMFKSAPAPQNNLQPSAQVVVFGDAAGEKVARALSGQLVPEVRYLEGGNE